MRYKKQTIFGEKTGNCYSTCIACLLNIPIEDVPNFCAEFPNNGDFWVETRKWLNKRGLDLITVNYAKDYIPTGLWIASGKSPRGDFQHAIIMEGNRLLHDPHPDSTGLDGSPKEMDIIFQLDPSDTKL